MVMNTPPPTIIVTFRAVACHRPKCRCNPPSPLPTLFPPGARSRATLFLFLLALRRGGGIMGASYHPIPRFAPVQGVDTMTGSRIRLASLTLAALLLAGSLQAAGPRDSLKKGTPE